MKLKYAVFILFFLSLISYAQEEIVTTDNIETRENDSLYGVDWKLIKMEPKFSIAIDLILTFDKSTNQLKVVKTQTSSPVLKGTDLITTKEESVNYYQWSYGVKESTFEGEDIKSTTYDYSIVELKNEGYAFKIDTINNDILVLKVIKSPKVIFGTSIFDVDKIYFKK